MKLRLLTKNIVYNTLISLVVLFIGELAVFIFLKSEISKETEEHLYGEYRSVVMKLKQGVDIELLNHNIGDKLTFTSVARPRYKHPLISEVEAKETDDEEGDNAHREEAFTSKQIVFDYPYKQQYYRFTIEKTIDEDEGLEANMFLIIFVSGVSMLVLLFIVNFLVYRRLFRPFYKTLKELKRFNLKDTNPVIFPETKTYEFNELNKALSFATRKSIEDYVVLREYVENVSHELQTPLTIINSKIELSLQEGNLNEKQARDLGIALNALERLSLVNQSLILLTKLENNLYESGERLNIADVLISRIEFFRDFIAGKELDVRVEKTADVYCVINKALCKILFDNLIKNAIKYNIQKGILKIHISNDEICILNSGTPPQKDPREYFQRFQRSGDSDSLGLGLSISRKICDLFGMTIDYTYENGFHQIVIKHQPV